MFEKPYKLIFEVYCQQQNRIGFEPFQGLTMAG
jgi:hypothetical protein